MTAPPPERVLGRRGQAGRPVLQGGGVPLTGALLKLAIFGGTFDPIHNGHLALARCAAGRFALDRVLLVPAARPPHKSGVTHAPYSDRVAMVELAVAGEPRFEVSRLEEHTERSYSIYTIDKVRATLAPGDL